MLQFKDTKQIERWLRDTNAGRAIVKRLTREQFEREIVKYEEIFEQWSYTRVTPFVILCYSSGAIELYGSPNRLTIREWPVPEERRGDPGMVIASACERRPHLADLAEAEGQLLLKGKIG